MTRSRENSQQIRLPTAQITKPIIVTFRLPKRLASGHTAKMPMPMGKPPMTETSIWVTPSL